MKIEEIIMLLEDIEKVEGNININLIALADELSVVYPVDELELKDCILNSIY